MPTHPPQDEERRRLRDKFRDAKRKEMPEPLGEDAALDAMVRKSIRDHGA